MKLFTGGASVVKAINRPQGLELQTGGNSSYDYDTVADLLYLWLTSTPSYYTSTPVNGMGSTTYGILDTTSSYHTTESTPATKQPRTQNLTQPQTDASPADKPTEVKPIEAQKTEEKPVVKEAENKPAATGDTKVTANKNNNMAQVSAQNGGDNSQTLTSGSSEVVAGAQSQSSAKPVQLVGYTRRNTPQQHIAFIKTHKCASSTIQNILMRYGFYHKLTFILPKGKGNHVGWPSPINPLTHSRKTGKTPDILCYHSVYSPKLVETMPKDTFYLAAVRDPFTQARSGYIYYNTYGCTQHKPLSTVIINSGPTQPGVCGTPFYNPVMRDMGMTPQDMASPSKVDNYIHMLDARFDLVMVVEHFDESLVILRDMLGWTDDDILSFAVNFRQEKSSESDVKKKAGVDLADTPENRAMVYKKWEADTKLYLHFKKKLEKIVMDNKDYLAAEVQKLQNYRNKWMGFCVSKSVPISQVKDRRFRTWGNAAYGYILTNEGLNNQTCVDLAMAELPWVGRLDKYQPAAP